MKKTTVHYSIDVAQGIVAFLLLVSSLLLWVVFPKGFYPSYLLWIDIHKWSGVALTVLVILHVALHWRWIIQKSRSFIRDARLNHKPATDIQTPIASGTHHLNHTPSPEIGPILSKQPVASTKGSSISDGDYS